MLEIATMYITLKYIFLPNRTKFGCAGTFLIDETSFFNVFNSFSDNSGFMDFIATCFSFNFPFCTIHNSPVLICQF